jgi:hypothetical protein
MIIDGDIFIFELAGHNISRKKETVLVRNKN